MFSKDFRARAREALRGKWNNYALIAFVYALIVGVASSLGTTGIGAVVPLLISGPFLLSWAIISLRLVRGADSTVTNLFDGFKSFVPSFLLYLVNSILTFLWSLLFVVPGIVKALSYSMSYYILAENPAMDQSDARKTSMAMMDGHKGRLFCLQLSFIGWYLLSGLTFGILLFWVQPYVQAATAAFFEDVRAQYIAKQQAAAAAQVPPVTEPQA